MLDRTCAYVKQTGRTVLGEPSISRADALRQLAAVGYKKVEAALRREATAADIQSQSSTNDTSDVSEAAGVTRTPALPDVRPGFAGVGRT